MPRIGDCSGCGNHTLIGKIPCMGPGVEWCPECSAPIFYTTPEAIRWEFEQHLAQEAGKPMQGLSVDVYRGLHDCTLGGLSARYNEFILVGEGVPGVFDVTPEMPALILVKRIIHGNPYLHARPADEPLPGNVGWMFGGNFIWTSDSRFPNKYPIAIHDRQETREQNKHLSR